jgi:hypothetical protein
MGLYVDVRAAHSCVSLSPSYERHASTHVGKSQVAEARPPQGAAATGESKERALEGRALVPGGGDHGPVVSHAAVAGLWSTQKVRI